MEVCPECEGSGVVDEGTEDERRCPTCGGSGFVPDDEGDDGRDVVRTSPPR
jgi:DnaJ-class molecular chaperone